MIKEISEKIKYITSGENPLSSDVILIDGDRATWVFDVGANDEAFEAIKQLIALSLQGDNSILKNELIQEGMTNAENVSLPDNVSLSDNISTPDSDSSQGKDVNIVISHFHRDHMGNLERIAKIPTTGKCVNLYVSSYTYKHCKTGIIVDEEITIDDGVKIRIFPMESSHSKGCLCLAVNDEVAFIGDAIYPAYKAIDDNSGKMDACVDKFDNRKDYRKQQKVYNVQHMKSQIEKLKSLDVKKVFLAHEKNPLVRKEIIVVFLERIYKKREAGNPYIIQSDM